MEQNTPPSSVLSKEFFAGATAMLIALPSAIAFGLIIYNAAGPAYSALGVTAGLLSTVAMGLTAPLLGSTKRIVTSPCAPAAAVLSVFVAELVHKGTAPSMIPLYVCLITFMTGLVQFLIGRTGGGAFIKYIPFPVVAGFMGGVGVLLVIGQLPKMLGLTGNAKIWDIASNPGLVNIDSLIVGLATILAMVYLPRLFRKVPPPIMALLAGVATYFVMAIFHPALLQLTHNPLIIGPVSASVSSLTESIGQTWLTVPMLTIGHITSVIVPVLTLAVLLSIDTLKTCLMLDSLTFNRHNSNKELMGQGYGNMASALVCGIPGAGGTGPTMVNYNSGGSTKLSGFFVGVTSLVVLLFLGKFFAWIPIPALAGILVVLGVRMVDVKRFAMIKNKSTAFDLVVILSVVMAALWFSLIFAAGVGIALAIVLFLKEQINTPVVRRQVFGNQVFSKKLRTMQEHQILETEGGKTAILELQGQLFFGTTDQLFNQLEPLFKKCTSFILDIRRVQSIDFTAVNMLKQIMARIKDKKGKIVFCPMPMSLVNGQQVDQYFVFLGLVPNDTLKFCTDLDTALAQLEDEILSAHNLDLHHQIELLEVEDLELFHAMKPDALRVLRACMENRILHEGEYVFRMGNESDGIYFVRKGTVRIELPLAQEKHFHLLTIGKGGILGEMAFIDQSSRSADARALETTYLFLMSRAKFQELSVSHPEVALHFVEQLAFLIANRLRQSNKELKVFQES